MAANKTVPQLYELTSLETGSLLYIVQSGVGYKTTLDSVFRAWNTSNYLSLNSGVYSIDDWNNLYGMGRLISGNLMISGNGLQSFGHLPVGVVLRIYNGNLIVNGTGVFSGLKDAETVLGYQNYSVGNSNIVLGQNNNLTGTFNIMDGRGNQVRNANYNLVEGINNVIQSSNNNLVVGTGNFVGASGFSTINVGFNNSGNSTGDIIFGRDNISVGHFSTLIGKNLVNSGNGIILIGNSLSAANNIKNYIAIGSGLTGTIENALQLGNNNDTRITIVSGKVAIGTTQNPIELLHVSGGNLRVDSTGNIGIINGGNFTSNSVSGAFAGVLAGQNNTARGISSSIGAGENNHVSGHYSFIGGGELNKISVGNPDASICGGNSNIIIGGQYNFIGGGFNNKVYNVHNHILGGQNNTIGDEGGSSINNSCLIGGDGNIVSGSYSCVIGGINCQIPLSHGGAAIMSDNTSNTKYSLGEKTLSLYYQNGVYITGSNLNISGNISGLGGISLGFTAKTANYTVGENDCIISIDATSANTLVTMLNPTGRVGRMFHVKKIDGTANFVTLTGHTANQVTFDGQLSRSLTSQWQSASVVSNGNNYLII